MNHSAQVLPNCSNTVDEKDGGFSRGGHYRMNVSVYACARLRKASHAASTSVKVRWQGMSESLTVVSPASQPLLVFMSYLAPLGVSVLQTACSGCCLVPRSC